MNLVEYLKWHYLYAPKRLPFIWRNFLTFIIHFFSIKELFLHFFAPWKRLTMKKGRGFNLKDFLDTLSYNFVSRLIGAFARSVLIIIGLTAAVVSVCLFPLIWLLWFFLPGLFYPLFVSLKKEEKIPKRFQKAGRISAKDVLKEFLITSLGKFFQKRLSIDLFPLTTINSFDILESSEVFSSWSTLITFLAENWPPLTQSLKENFLDKKDIQRVINWFEELEKEKDRKTRFWSLNSLLGTRPLGRDLTYGYTINLDKFATDLSTPLPYSHHLVGRQKEARMIEQVLSRSSQDNVLLIGEPGVGRTTIVLNFARMVAEGKTNPALSRKRVLELNLNALLSSAKNPQEIKGLLEIVFNEAIAAGNIILVIKHIDLYLSSGDGRVNLTDVFARSAASDTLQILGVTTPENYQKYLYPNPDIAKYFEKVEVSPPSIEEAYLIIERVAPVFEQRTKTFITYQAINEAIKKSDQYFIDLPFPEKAIDLLDEVCVSVAQRGRSIVLKEDVDRLLSEKTKIPVGEIGKEEVEKLANLETILHERIIDQEEAIEQIAKSMRRARTGISAKNRPIGTFLFLGPTGVGKTETAKALAEAYFGSESRMIRLDMSEYQTEDALSRAIGSAANREPGLFAKSIREEPFSLLLVDEIEKSDRKVLNLFLTILDEGYFTDAFGKKVDCRNLIIIATSNAGAEFIRQKVSAPDSQKVLHVPNLSKEVTEYVLHEGIFSPEFLNRFDGVVVFKPLTPEHLQKIAKLMLENLNQRLAAKDCSIKITPELIKQVAHQGYEPSFGARPMRRLIQDKIEDQIAQKMLKGEIKPGEELEIKF